MKIPEGAPRRAAASVLLLLLAFGLFLSPFTASWGNLRVPWYTPYILWGLLIALTAFIGSTPDDDA